MNTEIPAQPQPEAVEKPYDLYHTNVDGGGWINSFATLHEAKAEADRLQEESDRHGNWWQYRYHVYGPNGRKVYETVYNDELILLARNNEE